MLQNEVVLFVEPESMFEAHKSAIRTRPDELYKIRYSTHRIKNMLIGVGDATRSVRSSRILKVYGPAEVILNPQFADFCTALHRRLCLPPEDFPLKTSIRLSFVMLGQASTL